MLAIVKAVNFALAFCHPLVLCHEIIEAHGRPEGDGREGGMFGSQRPLSPHSTPSRTTPFRPSSAEMPTVSHAPVVDMRKALSGSLSRS